MNTARAAYFRTGGRGLFAQKRWLESTNLQGGARRNIGQTTRIAHVNVHEARLTHTRDDLALLLHEGAEAVQGGGT